MAGRERDQNVEGDRLAGEISTFWSLRVAKRRFSPPREGPLDVLRPMRLLRKSALSGGFKTMW